MRLLVPLFALGVPACWAQSADAPPIHVVRVGYGNVPALKAGIARSVTACRLFKKLPPAAAALPPDAQLAQLAVVEEEELFDGPWWGRFVVKRKISADAAQGCELALFAQREASVERSCESRVRGSTALLGELTDFETASASRPSVEEERLPASACKDKPLPYDLQGLTREDAGAARCVWSSAMSGRTAAAAGGFDTCLYEGRPAYYFQGQGRPVVLMTRAKSAGPGKVDIGSLFGEAAGTSNLKLKSFAAGSAIDHAKFSRAAVDAFVNQPAKTTVGGKS